MSRQIIFGFRISAEEKKLISTLADLLQRSQSDAVRFVVVNAAKELGRTIQQIETKVVSPGVGCNTTDVKHQGIQNLNDANSNG